MVKHDQRVRTAAIFGIPEFHIDLPVFACIGKRFDSILIRVGKVDGGNAMLAGYFGLLMLRKNQGGNHNDNDQ